MSPTCRLPSRNTSKTEGRPVLRPAGNTTTVPRKAVTPPSKPATLKVSLPSTIESAIPKLPSSPLKPSPAKPTVKQTYNSPDISDVQCKYAEKISDSGNAREAANAVSKTGADSGVMATSKNDAVSKAPSHGIAKSPGHPGRKLHGNSVRSGGFGLIDVSSSLPSSPPVVIKEIRPMDIQSHRRLKAAGFETKQGNLKAARIFPDGLLAAMSPPAEIKKRCGWIRPHSDLAYITYHDTEWGVPVHDDRILFELLVLVGAQAELTWPTVLSKREMFRTAFAGFDPTEVATFNEKKIASLKADCSIMQPEGKIRGIIENANRVLEIVEEFGSFDKYLWGFVNHKPIVSKYRLATQIPVKSSKSDLISRDMMKRGFRCVGPTVLYSFMQTVGMANDHLVSCFRYEELERQKEKDAKISHQIGKEVFVKDNERSNAASLCGN